MLGRRFVRTRSLKWSLNLKHICRKIKENIMIYWNAVKWSQFVQRIHIHRFTGEENSSLSVRHLVNYDLLHHVTLCYHFALKTIESRHHKRPQIWGFSQTGARVSQSLDTPKYCTSDETFSFSLFGWLWRAISFFHQKIKRKLFFHHMTLHPVLRVLSWKLR